MFYAPQNGLVCVILAFNCGAIVFCIGKHREGPISFTRRLPDQQPELEITVFVIPAVFSEDGLQALLLQQAEIGFIHPIARNHS